jgi:hypothetical protein
MSLLFALLALGAHAAEPVALVELFTSQGCSSCPPADSLVAELASEARSGEQPLVVLSFHVDYWNGLGWTDPYSAPTWTERQRAYARTLGESRIYTPQVVVDGTAHAVGSNRSLVKGLIAGALAKPAVATVSGEATVVDGGVKVRVRTEGAPSTAQVFAALVEPTRSNVVPRGENAGRTLTHANVVRALAVVPASGEVTLTVPRGVDADAVEVVAWVQDRLTNAVLGAAAL